MHNPIFKAIKGGLMAAGVVALAAGPALAAAPNSCSSTCKHHGKGVAKAAFTTLIADDNDCSSTCKHHGKASKAVYTTLVVADNDCSSTCKHHGKKIAKADFLG